MTEMHRVLNKGLAAVILLAVLAGCGSTPNSKHYILRARQLPPQADSTLSVGVGPIEVPEYLQRNSLVFSSGDNRVNLAHTQRWAEPLEDGIARVITLNLAGLLQTQDIRPYPWHPDRRPDFALKLRVLELEASPQSARLVAEWLVYDPAEDVPLNRRIAQFEEPLSSDGDDADAVARAYSDLFYQLSEAAATAISAAAAHSTPAKE